MKDEYILKVCVDNGVRIIGPIFVVIAVVLIFGVVYLHSFFHFFFHFSIFTFYLPHFLFFLKFQFDYYVNIFYLRNYFLITLIHTFPLVE